MSDLFFDVYRAPMSDKYIILPWENRNALVRLNLVDMRFLTNTPHDRRQDMVLGREAIWVDTLGM